MSCTKFSPRDHLIRQTEQRIEPCGFLGESSIASFHQTEQILDDVKWGLDISPKACLQLLKFPEESSHRIVGQCASFARSHRVMPTRFDFLLRVALLNALIADTREFNLLLTVQQFVRDAHVGRVGKCRDQLVRQARLGVYAIVSIYTEVLFVILLRSVHLWIVLAATVPGRRGRGDDRRIPHSAATHHQTFGSQILVDILEDGRRQLMILKQKAKLEQRCGIGSRVSGGVYAYEPTDRLAIVERVFNRLVGQSETSLRDVYAQHFLQSDRRTSTTFALRMEGGHRSQQPRPGRDRFDLDKKPITPRLASLGGKLKFRKIACTGRLQSNVAARIARLRLSGLKGLRRTNQCFPKTTAVVQLEARDPREVCHV